VPPQRGSMFAEAEALTIWLPLIFEVHSPNVRMS